MAGANPFTKLKRLLIVSHSPNVPRLSITAISGRRKEYTLEQMWKNYTSIAMSIYALSVSFMFAIMDYMHFGAWLDTIERFLFWLIVLMVYFPVNILTTLLSYLICQKWTKVSIYTPLMALPSALVVTTLIQLYLAHLQQGMVPAAQEFLPIFLTHYIIIVLLEVFAFEYILPSSTALNETMPPDLGGTSKMIPNINIGRKSFAAKEILHIQSADNYLEITTPKGTYTELGALRDISAKLPFELGCQINRSVWISYASIYKTEKVGKNVLVMTIDNRTFKASSPLRCVNLGV